MALDTSRTALGALAAALTGVTLLTSPAARAGDKHKGVVFLAQPATAPTYAAPVAVFSAPAYSAPLAAYPAPAAYSSPMSAYPVPAAYSAPATYMMSSTATATTAAVMSAPGAGQASRIKEANRRDLIEILQNADADKENRGKTTYDRRKALTEKARETYAEMVGAEDAELNKAEEADIDSIVNWIIDSDASGVIGNAPAALAPAIVGTQAAAGYPVSYYQAPTAYQPALAPAYPATTTFIQPMVPVQYLVPVTVEPKHRLFHR